MWAKSIDSQAGTLYSFQTLFILCHCLVAWKSSLTQIPCIILLHKIMHQVV
jgi:hypothetical protein